MKELAMMMLKKTIMFLSLQFARVGKISTNSFTLSTVTKTFKNADNSLNTENDVQYENIQFT